MLDLRRHALLSAAFGAFGWLCGLAVLPVSLADRLLLVGPLVAIPLGLLLAVGAAPTSTARGRWRLAFRWQALAALLLFGAFLFPPGALSALFALPWVLFTFYAAFLGGLRFAERGRLGPASELSIDAALLFLSVGGLWLAASRLGVSFLGFDEPLVRLTAAHFHFAGFVLPLVTGLDARACPGRASNAAVFGVLTGVPLVAFGITLTSYGVRLPELIAAVWLSAAAFVVAGLHVVLARRQREGGGQWLLGLSGAALFIAMVLAVGYAIGVFFELAWLSIPTMIATHAVLNVFGFALPALFFWVVFADHDTTPAAARDSAVNPGLCLLCTGLDATPEPDVWWQIEIAPEVDAGPRGRDRRDEHRLEVAGESPGEPERAGPFRRAAAAIARFDVFPLDTIRPLLRGTPVGVGDTIVCRYRLLPGLEALFAARVVDCFDELDGNTWRAGFTYRTLVGHPFAGEETFAVEKDVESGRVTVVIRSWSRPASLAAHVLGLWVRGRQLRAGRAGVEHLRTVSLAAPRADARIHDSAPS